MGLIKKLGAVSVFFLIALSPLLSQNAVSLASELFRLETLASGAAVNAAVPTAQERHSAFLALARLHRLSGNREAALRAYEGALALFPDDGQTLLEQGRFLISVGEHERAAIALSALLGRERERQLMLQGRYLNAQLQAFRFGSTAYLAALAGDPDFAGYRSGIYYTLWRLTGNAAYRNRLVTNFPQSPEARIAAGTVQFAATPLWLLFPGRDSIVLSEPSAAPPSGRFLQAGLFSREANATGFAEQLRRAGFEPQIVRRGSDRWAVGVNGGSDTNGMIRRLRQAGFEAFPI
ncbi:MAG: SPOR domain-containing protein [Treponema sp.]|nr:SPOR domain-containing protein [Treponema sp.]